MARHGPGEVVILVAVAAGAAQWSCASSGGGDIDPGRDAVGEADLPAPGDGRETADAATDADATGPRDGAPGETAEAEVRASEVDPVLAASLQALLDEHVSFSADPGMTLAVGLSDGAWWAGASGVRDLRTDAPMEPDSGFRVGSNTKPFVATLVLLLVDVGVIGLDNPLSRYLDGYPQWGDITIRQLLGMQSGIPDYLTDPALMLDFVADPSTAKTPQQILAYGKDQPLLYEPGTNGTYSNSNYLLLGLVIEEVAGDTLDHLIQARITGPLGLDHTFLDMTGEVRDHVARGYMDLNLVGQLFGVPPEVIAFIPEENHYEGSTVDCSDLFHPSLTWAAGALVSTAGDMARFMAALLGGDLLSPATLAMLGLQTRVEIDSYSPSDVDGYQMRLLLVSIAPTLFGKIGASGTYVLGPADATSVVTLVADLAVDAAMKPQRLCFNAVTDTMRESRVHVCDLDTFGGEAGQTLKLDGSLAVETDATKVEAILQVLAIPPCLCWTGDTAGACP